ncbi:stage III sporulation AC/AD family protein [Zongyangia hominis]|uniref:Stage III sporulation protein AD n=1 Tax=Zongyangia hominis TaxID=2763677 RepID=A0A926ED76_9FIRM|nr:stage III sporulation AC/AD family protein [Zongyangia hominis]MBC8569607.1 stage III sporulation protein AD [Zongyangia hominis]
MNIITIIGIGIVGMVLAVLLKQYKPEYAIGVSLAVGVTVFLVVLVQSLPIFEQIRDLFSNINMEFEYTGILFKSLGICFVTQLASDACVDAGQTAIASKIEIAGRVAVLLVSLPLFNVLLSIASKLINA